MSFKYFTVRNNNKEVVIRLYSNRADANIDNGSIFAIQTDSGPYYAATSGSSVGAVLSAIDKDGNKRYILSHRSAQIETPVLYGVYYNNTALDLRNDENFKYGMKVEIQGNSGKGNNTNVGGTGLCCFERTSAVSLGYLPIFDIPRFQIWGYGGGGGGIPVSSSWLSQRGEYGKGGRPARNINKTSIQPQFVYVSIGIPGMGSGLNGESGYTEGHSMYWHGGNGGMAGDKTSGGSFYKMNGGNGGDPKNYVNVSRDTYLTAYCKIYYLV